MDYSAWHLVAPEVSDLVHPVAIDPAGLLGPTRGQARGPGWRRVGPNRWVPAATSDDLVEQRIVEAYARCGPRAVVTGWAALRLQGGGFFDGLARDGRTRLDVPIAANGDRLRRRPGVRVNRFQVPDDEIVIVHGVRCAVVERALLDEIRQVRELREAVVSCDMAFAGQLTSTGRMAAYRWARFWYRDIRMLDRVLPLTSEHARSRPEVDLRLVMELDAGWGPLLVNRAVADRDGGFVAVPDVLDPGRRVAGEYAGAGHRRDGLGLADQERAEALRSVGIETVEFVHADLGDRAAVVRRLEEAADRALLLPSRWTLGGWTSPVASSDQFWWRQIP